MLDAIVLKTQFLQIKTENMTLALYFKNATLASRDQKLRKSTKNYANFMKKWLKILILKP